MAKKKKLRVGFVGAGGIAGTHAGNYQTMDDVEIVAAADVSAAGLKRFGEKFGVENIYADYKEMLKKEKLDAVSVCTPNFLHYKPTIDALNAGCHVLVEKPLAMNAAEGKKMIATAKKKRRHLVIGFQHRFGGDTQVVRRAFDEGFFGEILYVKIQAIRRRGIPNWGVFGRKDLQGGGPLIDIGVHAIEQAHYAIGSPEPVAASGQIWTYLGNKASKTMSQWQGWDHKTYTVEDLAVGTIRMKNGAMLHVESAFACHAPDTGMNFQVMGTKGGCSLNPLTFYHDHAGSMVNSTPSFVPRIKGFEYKMRHFVDVCLYGRKCEAPAEHGLMVQKMLDGIYDSAKKGAEIKIAK